MNFFAAINSGFIRFADFKGRSVRSEFWFWVLFIFVAELIISWLLDFTFVGLVLERIVGHFLFVVLPTLLGLVMVVPNLAVSARRLHDTGRSAWNLLWLLLPIIGWVVLIVFYCLPSEPRKNRFGKPSRVG
ncbi:MAG: DUF805 domain-containing protein [Candidatus Pacebacteria bacterium]|nr:DUF805 domain-containing protein [Candidatus Paceibacterota bacterium]